MIKNHSLLLLLAFFLQSTWGSAFADDHGNSISRATNVGLNSSTPGRIEQGGDSDYFKITVTGSGMLTVASAGSFDTYGYLLGSTGRALQSNDDGGSGTNFRIARAVSRGVYYVKVRGYSSHQKGNYGLNVGFISSSCDDHCDSISRATNVGLSSSTSGKIERGGDNDYFRIRITGSGMLTVSSTGSFDTYGYLLNSAGRVLLSNDDSGTGRNFKISKMVSRGTYYVRIRGYSSTGKGNYGLSVGFSDGSSDDHGNSISSATNVGLSSSTRGRIERVGDNDYFRIFVAGSGGTLTVNSTGSLDTYGYLLDSTGKTLQANDDNGLGTNFRISRRVSRGTYYVRVRAYSRSPIGSYGLRVAFSNARNVGLNSTTPSRIEQAGGSDYFKISVRRSGTLTVNSTGSFDTYGYFQDSTGRTLQSNDDGGSGTNFRISRSVSRGTYYVRVRGYSRNQTGNYRLRVAFR
jgi:membrane protein implicated in regulation of membrane protease activity